MDFLDHLFSPFLAPFIIGLIVFALSYLVLLFLGIRRNRSHLKTIFSREPAFAPINFAQTPKMDRFFFDQNTTVLLQLGFTPIGDFTIPHHPQRNYNRAFFHSAYYTYTYILQLREKGWGPILLKKAPPWLEFFTTFTDGVSLRTTTNRMAAFMIQRPQLILQQAPPATPLQVFNQHVQGVNEQIKQGKAPRSVSPAGFFADYQDRFRQEREFRQKFGYLHPQEIKSLIKRSLKMA